MSNDRDDREQRDDTAWESAMSRDFDARVRDLNEAPLDLDSVKGKAMTIRRNRRVAVAAGVLATAAVAVPVAAIAVNTGSNVHSEAPFASGSPSASPTEAVDSGGVDYVEGDTWHRADGTEVTLPHAYDSAVLWDGQLVGTRFGGEVYSTADVIDGDGDVVDSFDTTAAVAVNDTHTTIAWIGTDGQVMTRWDGGEVSMGQVDLAAAGEGVAWSVGAVTGGPDCHEAADGCVVYLNSGLGKGSTAYDSHGIQDSPVPGALKFFDASDDGQVTALTEVADDHTCGELVTPGTDPAWGPTCDYQVQQISPDGKHVAGLPSYFDGLGPASISVLDSADGHETGRFSPEGGFIGSWAWAGDGRLVFDTYDGASWHLMAMEPNGAITELTGPVKGNENSPFTVVGD
jgi:hypothetical protein